MGAVLHAGATVQCMHAGRATPAATASRVTVGGQAVAIQPPSWTVSGCTMPPPLAGNGPCATATWITASLRVTAMGQPVLLSDSQSICAPTGTPLQVLTSQVRVTAQ